MIDNQTDKLVIDKLHTQRDEKAKPNIDLTITALIKQITPPKEGNFCIKQFN